MDTTGAGDIFGGSALHRLLDFRVPPEELDRGGLEEIARFAVTAASPVSYTHLADQVLRTEFNADNQKIDGALKAMRDLIVSPSVLNAVLDKPVSYTHLLMGRAVGPPHFCAILKADAGGRNWLRPRLRVPERESIFEKGRMDMYRYEYVT